MPLLAVLFALVVGGVILLLLGVNPIEAYAAMISGAFGSTFGITQSIAKATPLLLVGLGICIAFRASVINIGAEGQIILGALGATAVSLAFRTLPGWLLIPLTMFVGFAFGAFWGFIPGVLKARFGVNEILSTVMLNVVAAANPHRHAARPVDGSGGRDGGHVSAAVRAIARGGVAAEVGATDAAAHRRDRGGDSGLCRVHLLVAHHDRLSHPRGGLESRLPHVMRVSVCRAIRRWR